jgi:hypothetical protein
MIERALRHGASHALVVSCGPEHCRYREGAKWTELRLTGQREPSLRTDKVAADQLHLLALDRTRTADLIRQADVLRRGQGASAARSPNRVTAVVGAAVLALVFGGVTGAVSDAVYTAPPVEGSQLVVSFKHPGGIGEHCVELSAEEIANTPIHMRKPQVCERSRASVRLRIELDGEEVFRNSYAPSGLWEDGSSVAVERLNVEPGEHRVRVAIGDSRDSDEWSYVDERDLSFSTSESQVVLFDRVTGFGWH